MNGQNVGGTVCGGWGAWYVYLTNCLVVHNTSASGSAGAGLNNPIAWNTIVMHNDRGVRQSSTAIPALTNCIVYDNKANFYAGEYAIGYSIAYTNAGTFIDPVNIYTNNPQLADPDNGDYRLTKDSPAFNAGLYASWMDNALDLDRSPRIHHGLPDIGAYELRIPIGTIILYR